MTDEIDQNKYMIDRIKGLQPRLEEVETKMQDTIVNMKDLRQSIPPSAEHMQESIKAIQINISKFKIENCSKFEDIEEQIRKSNDTKNLDKLKHQIITRQDDIVRALT